MYSLQSSKFDVDVRRARMFQEQWESVVYLVGVHRSIYHSSSMGTGVYYRGEYRALESDSLRLNLTTSDNRPPGVTQNVNIKLSAHPTTSRLFSISEIVQDNT